MRAITVRQPWAWAIVHGGKTTENRTVNLVGDYRGPILIHAAARKDETWREKQSGAHLEQVLRRLRPFSQRPHAVMGSIIGVADLVDVHHCRSDDIGRCCDPWGHHEYIDTRTLCDSEVDAQGVIVHLVLGNPRPLPEPIPARGFLHFWQPDDVVLARVAEQLGTVVR